VVDTRNPVDGLVEHYQHSSLPTRMPSRQRAALVARAARAAGADLVACFTHPYDAATPWDLPAIRDALTRDGLPLVEIGPADLATL
jgi:hypothetical protein